MGLQRNSWEGTVLVGPAQGQSTRFDPEEMSRSYWDKPASLSLAQSFFTSTTRFTRKHAAKEFVALWCAATHKGERDAFETEWESRAASTQSPNNTRKWPLDFQESREIAQRAIKREPSACPAITVKTEPDASASVSSDSWPAVADKEVIEACSSDSE